MNKRISSLFEKITPEEQKEVEDFINFLIIKRKINKKNISTDNISTDELIKLITKSGGFDWLNSDPENIYSLNDGEPVQW